MKNFFTGLLFGIAACLLLRLSHEAHRHGSAAQHITDTITITDTIKVVQPVLRDSVVVRYEVAKLQVVDTLLVLDSVAVQIPITQRIYADSSYTAWVSGYHARLDSIQVYPKQSVITIRSPSHSRGKPWSVGLQSGIGVTPRGIQPYAGIGITIKL